MIKRQEREHDPSFPSNAEFMNEQGYASTPKTSPLLLWWKWQLSLRSFQVSLYNFDITTKTSIAQHEKLWHKKKNKKEESKKILSF